MAFTVAEYMERTCVCGAPRRHHAHATEMGAPHGAFRVIGMTTDCGQFVDAIELELRGNPLANPHLAPLVSCDHSPCHPACPDRPGYLKDA